MVVRELPPSESCRIRVNLESRYGMCSLAAPFFSSVKAEITWPRQRRPLLIEIPSLSCWPWAPVFLILSDPARSTKWNLELISSVTVWSSPSLASSVDSIYLTIFYSIETVKIAWLRDDWSFMPVLEVTLWLIPVFRACKHSSWLFTSFSLRPRTEMTPLFSSLMCSSFNGFPVTLSLWAEAGSRRSCSSSL